MYDWSISYDRHNCVCMSGVIFSNLWVSLLPSIYIEYDISIIIEWSSVISIHIQIEWRTILSVLDNIFVSS